MLISFRPPQRWALHFQMHTAYTYVCTFFLFPHLYGDRLYTWFCIFPFSPNNNPRYIYIYNISPRSISTNRVTVLCCQLCASFIVLSHHYYNCLDCFYSSITSSAAMNNFAYINVCLEMVKNLPAMQETQIQSLGWENPLEKKMATHSIIPAWRIQFHGQTMGSQRVGHN